MNKWELIQIINRDCYEVEETIQMINELMDDIERDPKKFLYGLYEELETFARNNNKCPLCGDNIVKIDTEYEPSEYLGQPVQEKREIYGCKTSGCGYILNN